MAVRAGPRALLVVPSALRRRDFRLLWIGLLVSNVGDWINFVAMASVVYDETHSALAMAALRLFHIVPIVLLAPFAGVFVDRWERRRVLVMAPLLAAAAAGLLLVTHAVLAVFLSYGIITIAVMFFEPTVSALMPAIVPPEDLVGANSLSQITDTAAIIVGGVLGGAIVAGLGAGDAFGLNALSFLLIALCAASIRVRGTPAPHSEHSVLKDLQAGVAYLGEERLVAVIIGAGAAFIFAQATVFTLGIVFVETALHAGAHGYGTVLAGMGAGSVIGVVAMIRVGDRCADARIFAASGALTGGGIAALGLAHTVPVAALAYGVAGLGGVISTVAGITLLQRLVPNAMRGRIFSVSSTLDHAAAFASTLLVGVIGVEAGAGALITISGMVSLAIGVVVLSGLIRAHVTATSAGEVDPG